MAQRKRPQVFANRDDLAAAAARRWMELAAQAIAARGAFHVALSGGSTPRLLYQRLSGAEPAEKLDWSRVHIYFGDERAVAPSHADSNYRMARETLLDNVPIPAPQVHRIEADMAYVRQGAAAYARVLRTELPRSAHGEIQFDLVMLGVGPDGHVASLFPNSCILRERERPVAAAYVGKYKVWRISITLPTVNRARHIMVLVAGPDKADIMRRLFAESHGHPPLPVQLLEPSGEIEWYLDEAAAANLPPDVRQ